jgi:hypothetical protein
MKEVVTAPRSPWLRIRRADDRLDSERSLDHVVVLGRRHLRRLLKSYLSYYHR